MVLSTNWSLINGHHGCISRQKSSELFGHIRFCSLMLSFHFLWRGYSSFSFFLSFLSKLGCILLLLTPYLLNICLKTHQCFHMQVIFVDADQVVRADMGELYDMDIKGRPLAYTPFCDNNRDMDGYRFWRQVYFTD